MAEKKPEIIDVSLSVKRRFFPKLTHKQINNIKLTDVSMYSFSYLYDAKLCVDFIESFTTLSELIITDATAGIGGNSILFAEKCKQVNCIEIHELHCKILNHILQLHNFENIKVYNYNYLNIYNSIEEDIVFLDPPWTWDVDPRKYHHYDKLQLYLKNNIKQKINIIEIIKLLAVKKTRLVVLKVPYNFDFNTLYSTIVLKNIYKYMYYRNIWKELGKIHYNFVILSNSLPIKNDFNVHLYKNI